jgi:hypothetical protein
VHETQLARLTALTVESLLSDLVERDEDNYGRFVALFGAESPPSGNRDVWFKQELRTLSLGDPGAITLVALQLGDALSDYVFVRRNPSIAVARILEDWGIRSGAFVKRRNYRRLHTARLETLFDLDSPKPPI